MTPNPPRIHFLTPSLTVPCGEFSLHGESMSTTRQPALVTCPRCLKLLRKPARRAAVPERAP